MTGPFCDQGLINSCHNRNSIVNCNLHLVCCYLQLSNELHLLCCSTTKVAQAVTPKQALVQPAIATAPTQSLALGMVLPPAHTLLPSPHLPLHMPVAEAQAALLLHRPQLLPMGEQGNFPCLGPATCPSLDFEHAI